MVFVAVGDEDSSHPVGVFYQVGDVRDYQVYAQHTLFRKLDAAVHYDDVVPTLQREHVLANLPKPSQGNDT